MTNISKSSKRHSFQKNQYLEKCVKNNVEPNTSYIDFFDSIITSQNENEQDTNWAKNNLEHDLRTTDWILNKVRSSDEYAGDLYSALCNNDFIKRDTWSILKEETWGCSWRYSGGIIADMREEGDYIDWYCHGNEGIVTAEIEDDLYKLGWIVVTDNRN